mmetsp:Transcript_7743/g.13739  ORF Transcript_7743/g.13739 Transcript_7743/m.13739 type:complete len:181 (-) Transcript_7743:124-666(-)
MVLINVQYLAARFLSAALHLAIVLNVLSAASNHIVQALPSNCRYQAQLMPAACRSGTCAAVTDLLSKSCRQSWQRAEQTFLLELQVTVACIIAELLSMLTGVHSANAESHNFFGASLHAAGVFSLAVLLLQHGSCSWYHFIFAASLLPFLAELKYCFSVFSGNRPFKRFPPPETSAQLMQ